MLEGQMAEKIPTIQLLQRALHQPALPAKRLVQRSLEELNQLVEQLLAQVSEPR
jgi:hypothetical protein